MGKRLKEVLSDLQIVVFYCSSTDSNTILCNIKSDKSQEQAKHGENFLALNVILCCIFNLGWVIKENWGQKCNLI